MTVAEFNSIFLNSLMPCGYRILIVLGFNDTSTLEGHFVSSPREREKRDRRDSTDESGGQGRKRNRNESEETEEIKTFPLFLNSLQNMPCGYRKCSNI